MSEDRYIMSLGGVKKKGPIFLQQARMRGLKVWMVDSAKNVEQAPAIIKTADRISSLAYTNQDDCFEWTKTQVSRRNVFGIVALSEYSIEPAAVMAHTLGLPGNHPEVIRTIRNKYLCRQVLREHGFQQPDNMICMTVEEARDFVQLHPPGPWIIKPPSEAGSIGVSLVQADQDWDAAIQNLGYPLPAPFLIECFQYGTEYSAEGVFVAGKPYVLALTSKITTQAPHFIEVGHTMPAEFSAEQTRRIKETVNTALLTVGMHWGPFHVEFWLNQNEIVLGEIHARSGGDNLHPMTEIVTGIDMYGVVLDQLMQKSVDPASWNLYQQGAAIRYFSVPPGHVTAISGLEEVSADQTCVQVSCLLHQGDESMPITSSLDRHGFILARGQTAQEAREHAERLCQLVHINVEPTSTGSIDIKHQ